MAVDLHTCMLCHNSMSAEPDLRRPITGRICRRCLDRLGAEAGVPLADFLDDLGVPVLATDGDVVAKLANKPLLKLLGKNAAQVRGKRGGDVFECAYAQLPEGCGQTIHCSGCTIRRAVTETFITGRSLRNIPAYLNRDSLTQTLQLGLSISTEMVQGVVLLRIDRFGPELEASPPSRTN